MKNDKVEIFKSGLKSIFGAVPVAGTALNELFFEYNSNIKQKRLNRFIEILSEYFSQNSSINIDNIKTENFNDIFESVLKRVVLSRSDLKLIRFKDILVNELLNPTEQPELVDWYIEFIADLSEIELKILFYHKDFNNDYEVMIDNYNKLKDRLRSINDMQRKQTIIIDTPKHNNEKFELSEKIKKIEQKISDLKEYRTAKYYNLTEQEFLFYKQRLFSKGLFIDNGIDRIGTSPFQAMGITEFGFDFIEFIKRK